MQLLSSNRIGSLVCSLPSRECSRTHQRLGQTKDRGIWTLTERWRDKSIEIRIYYRRWACNQVKYEMMMMMSCRWYRGKKSIVIMLKFRDEIHGNPHRARALSIHCLVLSIQKCLNKYVPKGDHFRIIFCNWIPIIISCNSYYNDFCTRMREIERETRMDLMEMNEFFSFISLAAHIKRFTSNRFCIWLQCFFLFICLLVRSSKKHCKSSIHLIIISMVGFWGFGAWYCFLSMLSKNICNQQFEPQTI